MAAREAMATAVTPFREAAWKGMELLRRNWTRSGLASTFRVYTVRLLTLWMETSFFSTSLEFEIANWCFSSSCLTRNPILSFPITTFSILIAGFWPGE